MFTVGEENGKAGHLPALLGWYGKVFHSLRFLNCLFTEAELKKRYIPKQAVCTKVYEMMALERSSGSCGTLGATLRSLNLTLNIGEP